MLRRNELESEEIPDGSLYGGRSLALASVVVFLNRVRECFVDGEHASIPGIIADFSLSGCVPRQQK